MDDAALKNLLAGDAPAAHDILFEIALLSRIEQRRFRRELVKTIFLAVAATILLALLMPDIEIVWQQRFADTLSNGMIAAMLFAVLLPVQYWIARRA